MAETVELANSTDRITTVIDLLSRVHVPEVDEKLPNHRQYKDNERCPENYRHMFLSSRSCKEGSAYKGACREYHRVKR
jgi:hypothetical protein